MKPDDSSHITKRRVGEHEPLRFPWGTIDWLVSDDRVPGASLTVGYVEIAPGQHNDRHFHPNCDEVLFLIEGELDHALGDDTIRLGPGDALFIPRGTQHRAVNIGNTPARMMVSYPTGTRQMQIVES